MKTGVWAFVFAFILLTSSVYAMPNPAAVYCRELGYSYKIVKGDGGERGVCILPDRDCDEWEFFAGKCGKEHSYCARQGYETKEGNDEAVCEFKSSLVNELTGIPVGKLMKLEERMSCDSEPRDRKADLGSKPPMMTEYNASYFPYWDWRDPPNSTRYGSANFTYFDDSHGWGTDVKDQGGCGSCWAFSAVGAMEAKYNMGRNESRLNTDMSEQYLVSDCNIDPYYSLYQNCCGGWMDLAMEYTKTDGIPDESCLSYVDGSGCSCGGGTCDSNCNYDTGGNCSDTICSDRCSSYTQRLWTITDYTCTWPGPVTNNETKQYILDYGPLSAAIGFTSYGLYQDTGCIYRCSDDSGTSHGVVLVGYNDTGNATTSYWIIKNSWGTGWPSGGCNMGGYFKLGFNECNFTSEFNFADIVNAPNFRPSITLNNPETESNSTRIYFNFTVCNRDASSSTCDLLIDNNVTNTTMASNDTPMTMSYSLPEGNYNWSVECWEHDIGIANSSETMALKVAVPPKITVSSPDNTTYDSLLISVNVTTNESADWCGWNLNGTENTTMTNASTTSWNGTITQISEGTYRLYVYCNDTFGGMGLNSSVFFTYDTPPDISNVSIIPSIAKPYSNATVIAKITDISMDYAYVTGYNTSWDKVYNETNLTQSDNEWYLTFNVSNNTEGLCYLNLTAFDTSWNNATWTGNITINNTLGADDVIVNTSWSTTGNYTILNFSYLNLTLEINTSQELVNTTVGAASYTEDPVGESNLVHLGKYVQAEMSHYVEQNLLWVIIKLFYADSEVSSKGINESTLMLYYYNETTGNWSSELGGVNTSGNYVWGNTTHFSFYGIFGSNTTTTTSTTTTVSSPGSSGGRKTTSTTTSNSTSSTVSTTTTKEAPITGQIIEEKTTTTVEPVKEEPEIPVLWIAVPVILLAVIITFVYRAKTPTKKLPPPPVPIVKINRILSSPEKYIGKKVMVEGTVTFSRHMPDKTLYRITDSTGEMGGVSKESGHKGEGMVEGVVRRHKRGVCIEF